jgi:hypothetical protein
MSPWSNRRLVFFTTLILILQLIVIYLPPLQLVFGTCALSARQLAVPLLAGSFVLAVMELAKRFGRTA